MDISSSQVYEWGLVKQIKASVKEKKNLLRNILRRTRNASFLKKLEVLQTKLQNLTEAPKVGYHNQISKKLCSSHISPKY